MGIKGLKTYMQKRYKWEEIGKYPPLRGPLLIDAMSCCYSLYDGIDWKYGGQYKELDQKCKTFLASLKESGIEPILVFDGVDHKREKASTFKERGKDKAKCIQTVLLEGNEYKADGCLCLPVFAKVVFMEVIKKFRIPFIVADGDADSLTASMANFYGCPALASDSDYYIFNVKGGYIPFEYFHWKSKPINGKIYHSSNFSAKFRDPEIIYLIPALIGNDFLESPGITRDVITSVIGGGIGRRGNNIYIDDELVARLVDHIASLSSFEEFFSSSCKSLKSEKVMLIRENFYKAKEMYSVDKISMDDVMKSTVLETANGTPLPSWILKQYRAGCFSTSVMKPMVLNECMLPMIIDNPKKESNMKIGEPLRRHLYGFLKPYLKVQKVKEGIHVHVCVRVGQYDVQYTVKTLTAQSLITNVDLIRDDERLKLLCDIIGVSPDKLDKFEDKWKLVALSLHYWSRNAEALTQQQIDSLLFCFVVYFSEQGRGIIASHFRFQIDGRWTNRQLDSLHSFSMWQCVYNEAMKLNDVLKRPLEFTSPALLFNGRLCLSYACMKEADFDAIKEETLTSFLDMALLYEELLSVCSPREVSKGSSSHKTSKEKHKQPAAAKKAHSTPVSTKNPFELPPDFDEENQLC
ncbi:PREDICTED: protein asteroid homolog 1-like [Amphimedon queenslandica]|uniref:XPG N-terminal domain-containing protein n=1 Tax=Amphimedon queenslandica TaxID=400682 RepID=A0A1X7UMN6_AMPQE|nr:PREDICTED: protein asteroid homolog 1-like [Amphimedon queenslandica]|eukprot:XP_011404642.1 PREDICTED: protein asteroid homolog 1-like [Amphimedon queenslandica]